MLGKKLKNLRGKRTQEEIAKAVGLSRARYAHYENDIREPDLETLERFADFFDVSIDYLLGRTEKQNLTHQEPEDADFQAFANNPELQKFYKELPYSKEEAVKRLRDIWEILKHES
ncbi:helix-turn-helix domain-containing protein [Lysinibacillus sp. FSL W8-0992]|uniref:helix-turn-helix domain-containing protein n=1 Tax=Lysinibacillus sp. FSL W8-0992 TaxID=2954643 RepID=UPI0030FB0292